MKAVCYYRYSTGNIKQVDNSEARQRDAVERIVYSNGWELVRHFTDHATSGADDKPELLKLQKMIVEGTLVCDVLCVDSLSRLTRRGFTKIGLDLDWIENAGILLSVAEQNSGKPFSYQEFDEDLTLGVKTWMNHRYVKDRSRESTNGMRKKFSDGKLGWIGKAPFGYDLIRFIDDKPSILQPNGDLPIVKEIFESFLSGMSIYECTSLLAKSSRYSLEGARQPARGSVINILRNAIYCGIRTIGVRGVGKYNTVALHRHTYVKQNPIAQCADYHEYKVEGFVAPISLEQFNRTQERLDAGQEKFKSFPKRHRHEYSGLLRCDHCSAALTASSYQHNGKKLVRYVCPNSTHAYNKKCDDSQKPKRKQVRDDEIEKLISESFSKLLFDVDFHRSNLTQITDRLRKYSRNNIDVLEQDIAIQQKRLDELVELFQETGSESLKASIQQQVRKIDSAKENTKNTIQEDKLLRLCIDEQAEIGISNSRFLYFGHIYEYAIDISLIEDVQDRCSAIEQCSSAIAAYTQDYAEMNNDFYRAQGKDASGTDRIMDLHNEERMPVESQISILRRMGLDHIRVRFQMQKWRGRDRRVPVFADLVFLVALEDYTRIHVVHKRNQTEILQPRTTNSLY